MGESRRGFDFVVLLCLRTCRAAGRCLGARRSLGGTLSMVEQFLLFDLRERNIGAVVLLTDALVGRLLCEP